MACGKALREPGRATQPPHAQRTWPNLAKSKMSEVKEEKSEEQDEVDEHEEAPEAEIPDDAGSGSGQETMGQAGNERGQFLTPEEQAPLVAMPECLVNEIGFRAKLDYGEWVLRFFERYTMQTSRDCKFETHPVTVTGPGFGGMTMYCTCPRLSLHPCTIGGFNGVKCNPQ
mmetsp:Transcript_16509/g.36501  ORF Transcript_16509/g.36501 Transcript_16509/m.36501 type:complete len:171 (-) Transcript_16509:336-848(-)